VNHLLSAAEMEALLAAVRPGALPDASAPVTVSLGPGSIVGLELATGGEVEVLLDNQPIARGVVVVSDGRPGIRVTAVAAPPERGAGSSSAGGSP
jgi:hypothetical protein